MDGSRTTFKSWDVKEYNKKTRPKHHAHYNKNESSSSKHEEPKKEHCETRESCKKRGVCDKKDNCGKDVWETKEFYERSRRETRSKGFTRYVQGAQFQDHFEKISLGQLFFNSAQKYHAKMCQIFGNEDAAETFGSVKTRTARLALDLEKHGVSCKDTIAVFSDNTMDNLIPVIAAMYIGAKVVNIDHTFNSKQTKQLLLLTTPSVVFVEETLHPVLKEAVKEANLKTWIITLGQYMKPYRDEESFAPSKIDVHETAIMFFTSGVAGIPKAVCHSHHTLLRLVQTVCNSGLVTSCVLHFATFCWLAMVVLVICCFMHGCTRVFARDINEKVLSYVEKYKVKTIFMAPFQARYLWGIPRELQRRFDLTSLSYIIVTGTQMSAKHLAAVTASFPNVLLIFLYGVAEVGLVTTFNPITQKELVQKKTGSCGMVAPEVKIKVAHIETGMSLEPYMKGEIRLKSPCLMKGYHSLDCTEYFDQDGFLKTGDVGYYDEDECFFVLDRIKEIFTYMNHTIVPSYLESILLTHPGVLEAGVFGLPAREQGEMPAACVVLQSGVFITEGEIENYVAEKVLDEERLRGGVKFVSHIPKASTGRYIRRELKKIFLEAKQGSKMSLFNMM